MAVERTLSIIKPDAVAKNVIGQIYVCTQPQTANQSPRSVVICQPADGEIHFSPVHLTWFALAAPGEQPTVRCSTRSAK